LLTISEDTLIVLSAIVISLIFWWVVRWMWPPDRRRVHNEITGWQLSVLGTTYAVIIGFMLFAAWAEYRAAEQNVANEASCLINLYWTASGLPQGQGAEIRKLAADYAEAMIADDWPAMSRGEFSSAGTHIMQQMWTSASQPLTLTVAQQANLQQTLVELGSITEHRRIREMQSETTLPAVLWAVLIVGAVITIMSSCLFGSEYPFLHLLQVVTLALLLSLSLVAVADINRPFRGAVHVAPTGFENAKRVFEKYP
jgi:hypothetical protein